MARTEASERAKAAAIAAGWKLRHIRINLPDETGQLVCQDAYGRTLMHNGTWTMDPLQAGGWNNAASVRINKDSYSYSRRSAVPEEPFPPINPHAIVQAPAEDEDGLTRSLLVAYYLFQKALAFRTNAASSSRNTTVIISLFRQSTLLPLCRHLRRTKMC